MYGVRAYSNIQQSYRQWKKPDVLHFLDFQTRFLTSSVLTQRGGYLSMYIIPTRFLGIGMDYAVLFLIDSHASILLDFAVSFYSIHVIYTFWQLKNNLWQRCTRRIFINASNSLASKYTQYILHCSLDRTHNALQHTYIVNNNNVIYISICHIYFRWFSHGIW